MARVLFIVGKGRSGTTLLGNLMGQADRFVSVGELWRLWQEDPAATLCGCGSTLPACELWSVVLDRVDVSEERRRAMLDRQQRVMSWTSAPAMLWRPLRTPGFRRSLAEYGAVMASLYRAVAEAAAAEVVVDTSKWPLDPGLLGHAGVDAFGVHVVRDPRAVAHSWRRRKAYPGGGEMPRFSPVYSAVSWSARNLLAEWARRRVAPRWLRLRYEDLVADPVGAVGDIMTLVGASGGAPGVEDGKVALAPSHTVAGNPDRMDAGPVELRVDDAWRRESGRLANAAVVSLCFPLMVRYGYPLRRRP